MPANHTSRPDLLKLVQEVVQRLPAIEFAERRWGEIDSYGANWMLARQLGLPRPLEVYDTINWNHGVTDIGQVSASPAKLCSVLNYNYPNEGRGRTVLVADARTEQLLHAAGYQRAKAIGLPFIYEKQETDIPRIPGSVLAFGTHSTPWFSLFDQKVNAVDGKSPALSFPKAVAALQDRFSLVAGCVGASDVLLGNWLNAYEHNGVPWITGAWINDRNALLRMQRLFRSFEYVATNTRGSHIFYALYCGCKVFWHGDDSDVNFSHVVRLDPASLKQSDAENQRHVREGEARFRELYPFLFCQPEEAVANVAVGQAVLGESHRLPQHEVAALLGWRLKPSTPQAWQAADPLDLCPVPELAARFKDGLKFADSATLRSLLLALIARGKIPRNGYLAVAYKLVAEGRLAEAKDALAEELKHFPDNVAACNALAEQAQGALGEKDAGSDHAQKRILFLAHGPGQVNGPNIWLTRLLPALKARGYSPRVLMFLTRNVPCPIADQLRAAGIPCDTAPWAHTEDMVRMILNYVRTNPCDVFVPNLNVQGYFAASVLKAAGIPTIGVLHSDDDFYRDLTDEFVREQGGRHLSAAVTVSVFQHEALLALDHGPTKIVRAPYGAPVPETSASHRTKPFRFVYIGRVVDEQKRISDTVRAMIALLRRQPDVEFHLCGDGTARPVVQALIKSSGLGDRIRLLGNLPSDEVRLMLLDSQAMVLLSDYEGIPIALMEAMGCGVVPICTKIRSGIGEIVQDGKSGLLVSDRDQDFIAAAERLLRDPALWARCSAAARAVIQKDFSVGTNADTWVTLMEELQAAAPRSRRRIELPTQLNLPPVRTNPKGIAREDRRKPQTVSPPKIVGRTIPDQRGDLPVVLVRSHEFNYSETFVEDHVNHLTRNLTLLYGFPFPRFLKGGRSVLPETLETKLKSVLTAGKGVPSELWREYTAALSLFLKSCGAESALVETGLMGAFVHEACEQAGLPYVVHFHGVDAFGKELLANWSGHYRKFFRTAAGVIAVSKAMREQLLQLGAEAARTVLAPYGVAVDLPALADPAKAPPHFVAVGRFVEKKAPQLTLQAFAAVHQALPQATLVMIGDGPLLAGCRQWVQERGLATAVMFAGVCSREEVSRHLAAGRAFVQHSVTASNGDSEGLPLAVLEAGAHGLPVVSTLHAGIPDAVRADVDGFLVPERDVAAMTAAMLRLARDAGLAATLGLSFRARVVADYSRERSLTRLLGILQAAAEGRPAQQREEPARPDEAAVQQAQPRHPRLAIAEDRNDQAAYIELGASLLDQDQFAGAYIAIGEGHRLSGGTPETVAALQQLEGLGITADVEVEKYRRRAGWLPSARHPQPYRILVVTNLLPPQEMGGYGRTVWEFAQELLARGHEVRVLTADMPHLLRKPGPEHAAMEPNVKRVLRLCGDWKDGAVVVEPDVARRQAIVRENHRLITIAIEDFRPDVIMAGNLDFVGHFFIQPALDRGIPVLHRLGNAFPGYDPAHSPRGPLFCLAGCSEWVNRGLRAKNYPISRYEVVPPGSPLTEYFRAWTPQRARLRIAYAGLLMPYKGAHVLVTALAYLKRVGIEFECTLAGDTTRPDYLESLRAVATQHGFMDQLHFPGFLGKRELAGLFARSNVLVFPSVFEEPFGKTQIEAMAAGLLVVSSGSGGASEIVEDGKTGLLFKGGDSRDLAEKLLSAHRHPRATEQIALAGQARAFEFTTEASVDRLERLFGELLATARGAGPALAAPAVASSASVA